MNYLNKKIVHFLNKNAQKREIFFTRRRKKLSKSENLSSFTHLESLPQIRHSSGKKSPCLAGAYNKRFCINYYFARIKNFFQYIHAIIWYMYVMSVVHACNEIIAGLHEKNQSLPFEKSDGSDFFIERLRQIYQKALILEGISISVYTIRDYSYIGLTD